MSNIITRVIAWIRQLPQEEPAVLFGGAVSLIAAIAEALANAPTATTWVAAAPIILTTCLRFVVVSPATAKRRELNAHRQGKTEAKQEANDARRKRRDVAKATAKKAAGSESSPARRAKKLKASERPAAQSKRRSRTN